MIQFGVLTLCNTNYLCEYKYFFVNLMSSIRIVFAQKKKATCLNNSLIDC